MRRSLQPIDQMVPGANLPAYVQAVSSIPILSAERERELAEDLYFNDNLAAARELVMSHLRFVVHIARSYSGYGLAEADLIQEGNVGLMKAVKRFNPEKGVRLVSFAVHWIKAEMHEYILRNWRIVKVATTKAQRKLFFNLRSAKKRLGWFTREEVESVARDLDVKPETVLEMESRLSNQDLAFDGDDSDDEEGPAAPSSYLPDMRMEPASALERQDTMIDRYDRLHAALEGLDERSKTILQARWLTEKKQTLHELAAQFGVSAERIRQIEKNAMRKMKTHLEA